MEIVGCIIRFRYAESTEAAFAVELESLFDADEDSWGWG
jgi:hypothetical protein